MALVLVWVVDTGMPPTLDSSRQNYLLNSIGDIQTIVTCTGLDEFVNNRFEINRIFHVSQGQVSDYSVTVHSSARTSQMPCLHEQMTGSERTEGAPVSEQR